MECWSMGVLETHSLGNRVASSFHYSMTPLPHFFMLLLLDIGNTNTHLGFASRARVLRQANIPTAAWADGSANKLARKFTGRAQLEGAALCSVVPRATPLALKTIAGLWDLDCVELSPATVRGVGIDYQTPATIGGERPAK